MAGILNRIRILEDRFDHPVSLVGMSDLPLRLVAVLSAVILLGVFACASEQGTTEPSGSPRVARDAGIYSAANPSVAVNPSKNLDPDGRTVTMIGKGFPVDVTVQLSECTGSPLVCLVLLNVQTDKHGMFVSRILVAFDLTVIYPFPPVPTCSEPTFTGDACLLFAVATNGAPSAFDPITFSN
jgi:hypothetical protein